MTNIPKTMKAIVLEDYNRLNYVDLEVPKPGRGEVLCRVRAIAICGTDPKVIRGDFAYIPWPPYFPFVMGHEWSGEVVQVGEGVTEFKPGDRVAGEAHCGCGVCKMCREGHYTVCLNYGKDGHDGGVDMGHRHYGFYYQGANAEYNVYKKQTLHKIPDSMTFDVATLCDTAGVACHGVEQAGVTPGGTCVVFGPGPIGLCAMQIAKGMGSSQVIMIGRGPRLQMAKELGADVIIDFEKEDVVARVRELTDGVGADEVMECSGAPTSPIQGCQMLKKTGSMALIAGYHDGPDSLPLPLSLINFNELRIVGSKANPNVSDKVIKYLSNGTINGEKIISHRFPLAEYEKALDIFVHRKEGAIKVVVNP